MRNLPPEITEWDRNALIGYWRAYFGQDPPSHLRTEFMRMAVAWQVQAGSAPGRRGRRPVVVGKSGAPPLSEGTRLVREWRGKTHVVTRLESGYEHAGRTYRSLSAIAREITGTPWSGPAFFGIGR